MSVNEQWDIVSGIGFTALIVAACRALETRREDRLISDPYAEHLVRAANSPTALPEDEAGAETIGHEIVDYLGVCSRYFDDWFGQAVVLAAGLDTRAFRISWPDEFRLFEIDQPKVLAFKEAVLAPGGTRASCQHKSIPVDLRDDWAGALGAAGFDPGIPTAWLAEGLLPYLPAEAEQRLVNTVHELSAPGSRSAVESVGGVRSGLAEMDSVRQAAQLWGLDLNALFDVEDRPDPGGLFTGAGRLVHKERMGEVIARSGRKLGGLFAGVADSGLMLTAELPR